jgi:hypothetical protein
MVQDKSCAWQRELDGWRFGYGLALEISNAILRIPGLRKPGSNFEVIARK